MNSFTCIVSVVYANDILTSKVLHNLIIFPSISSEPLNRIEMISHSFGGALLNFQEAIFSINTTGIPEKNEVHLNSSSDGNECCFYMVTKMIINTLKNGNVIFFKPHF